MTHAQRRNRSGTVLITGFGRFPGAAFNPSEQIVRRLAHVRRPAFSDVRLIGHVFPTSYAAVDRDLPALIAHYQPDILLMFGVAPKSRQVRIETLARNVLSRFPDATRVSPASRTISAGRPAKIASRIPATRLLQAARARRSATALSRNAGRYLCNYIYWRALEAAAKPGGPKLAAFIHVPPLQSAGSRQRNGKTPQPSLSDLVKAGEAILAALIGAAKRPH